MRKRKILVIDDENSAVDLIESVLEPLNLQVLKARNGIEGIRMALRYHPDLMTVDLVMPDLNGLMMMKILNLLQLHIPTLFVTQRDDVDKFLNTFPNIVNKCAKSEIRTLLSGKISEALENRTRSYTDIQYSLNQEEFMRLVGKSDRKKILIATRSEFGAELVKMLEQTNLYEIYFTTDGQEALFKAITIQPELLLVDVDVSVIDGFWMARILYILGHPIPLMIVTEKSDAATVSKASKLEGIKGYMIASSIQQDQQQFFKKIEEILNVSDEEKMALQETYQNIDLKKIAEEDDTTVGELDFKSFWAEM